jgi:PhzF family phenazine biosynthesis protein
VPFCGHATIATGVLLGKNCGCGTYQLTTEVGIVPVTVRDRDGQYQASLTSVTPSSKPAPATLLAPILAALGWQESDCDQSIPPALAYAGSWHLVLATRTLERLNQLNYDFELLKTLMLDAELTTLQLVWRENATEKPIVFHARNPFPIGGVIEDPATGSAAAALGGYLRDAKLITAPQIVMIRQGEAMGRPSRIWVDIPTTGGIVVTGQAVWL